MTGKKTELIIFTLFLTVPFSFLLGHGVKVNVTQKPPNIIVHAAYHGGRALPEATVTVTYQAETVPFKEGRTNADGSFSFSPDKPGKWTILVDDLTGHRKKLKLQVDESFFPAPSEIDTKTGPVTPKPKDSVTASDSALQKKDPSPPTEEDKPTPPTKADMYWYLGKIFLGILLIAAVSFIMHRLVSKTEKK